MTQPGSSGLYALGDWPLAGGGVLRDARLGYRVWGEPNDSGDNFIVLPTYYTGAHDDYAPLIGADVVFDSNRFCVVAVDLFGNGVSTSPSNAHPSQRGSAFPRVGVGDAVAAQRHFLTRALGMCGVALVAGWSLGGVQAYQWAADFPGQVRRLLPWCAAARCSTHNRVFLDGARAALTADGAFRGGDFTAPPRAGLRAFARVYCGWAYSQAFFRNAGWRELGFRDVEALLVAWEDEHLAWDANDLLSKLATWEHARLDAADEAAFTRRLRGITADTIAVPCATDQYFTVADNEREVACLPGGRMRVVDSDWGHVAGGPGRHEGFTAALREAAAELLTDYRPGEGSGQ